MAAMEKPMPQPWMLRLRDDLAAGTPLARLRRRYSVTNEYIERLYALYGWGEMTATTQTKTRLRRPGAPRKLPGNGSMSVQLSIRLREAWLRYGLEGLQDGLAALETNLDLIAVENIGVDETAHPTKLNLSRAEALRIDILDDRSIRHHHRTPSKSLIVRQALEQVILLRDDKELMKPPGWESRPLDGAQGGKSAWTLPGETLTKSFSIPRYLYHQIEHMRTRKGTTAHDPSKPNLSRWMREAIDSVDDPAAMKRYVPLEARKLKGYTTSGTIPLVLQSEQVGKLTAIQEATGCNQSEAVAVAVAYRLKFEPDESLWLIWRAVATSGLDAVAKKLEVEVGVLAQQLIAAGYLKPTGSKQIEVIASSSKEPTDASESI